MRSEIAEFVELAFVHMLYARAELQISIDDTDAAQRTLDHLYEAVGLLRTAAPCAVNEGAGDIHALSEYIEFILIQMVCACAKTSDAVADLSALIHINEAIIMLQLLAPQRGDALPDVA